MRVSHFLAIRALVVLASIAAGGPVTAQIASGGDCPLFRSDAAGVRIEPQYEPTPLVLGPLIADLRLTTQANVESNVFHVPKNGVGDTIFVALPSLRILGTFGPHSATLAARASIRRFTKLKTENSATFDLTYGGRLDLGDGAQATWLTQFTRDTESRGSSGSNVIAAGPAELQILRTSWTARADFGALGISTTANVVQRTYRPLVLTKGGVLDQSFRDTRAVSVSSRANFSISPPLSVFVAGSATKTTSLDRSRAAERDASGYALLAGVRGEIDGLIIGEIGVGYRRQHYSNPRFQGFGGFTYDATIDWYPTPLVSVRVQAGQDIVNGGLTTVAGIERQTIGANIYYDPLRNLHFTVTADREHDSFRELRLRTNTGTVTLTGRYQFGRHLALSAYGRAQRKGSSDSNQLSGYHSLAAGFALTGSL